jgi:TPR repeat protein
MLNAMVASSRSATPDDENLRRQLVGKLSSGNDCEDKALTDIRKKAFDREVEDVFFTKCSVPRKCSENEIGTFINQSWNQESDDVIRILLQRESKKNFPQNKIVEVSQLYPEVGVTLTTAGFENLRAYLLDKADLPSGKTAVQSWRLLGDQGNVIAQSKLGGMYLDGEGVPQDDVEGARWFRKAAEQGHKDSQGMLGAMYARGLGVPQNNVQAYMWFSLAVANIPESVEGRQARDGVVKIRGELAAQMTPEQIAEAQKLAREWKPTPGAIRQRRQ